jgi:hypothetical protein
VTPRRVWLVALVLLMVPVLLVALSRTTSEPARIPPPAVLPDPTVTAEPEGTRTTFTPDRDLPALTVRPYRVIKDTSLRRIPRGQWFDVGTYPMQALRPTTHVLQVNLNVRRATGPRPTHVTVGWQVRSPRGTHRFGTATFAVPQRRGDYPFQITHRVTTWGEGGRATAQVYVSGRGSVTTRLTVAKAIVWVEPGAQLS